MESKTKMTVLKRILAFIFDFIFIMLLAFIVYMLFGLLFKLDSVGYQKYMSLILLILIISYLIPGEFVFKNSLGKFLFGIEIAGKERPGNTGTGSVVVNKETNRLRPPARFIIGIVVLIALLLSFRIAMGLAVRHSDFYKSGTDYLENKYEVKVGGLTKVVDQKRNSVNFIVPVSGENNNRYGIIYLHRNGDGWSVDSVQFTKEHILGFSYGLSYSSAK